MTENKKTVEKYMEGFRRSDHQIILNCLTESCAHTHDSYVTNDHFACVCLQACHRLLPRARAQRAQRMHERQRLIQPVRLPYFSLQAGSSCKARKGFLRIREGGSAKCIGLFMNPSKPWTKQNNSTHGAFATHIPPVSRIPLHECCWLIKPIGVPMVGSHWMRKSSY